MTINDLPKKLQVEGVKIYNKGDHIHINLSERQTLQALAINADVAQKKETA